MRHVVIGGGIGGVCCAEELCRLAPEDEVVLISASPVLKGVSGVVRLAKHVEEFTVVEKHPEALARPNLRVLQGRVAGVDLEKGILMLDGGGGGGPAEELRYDRLCVCAGARPKVLAPHERVVTLRDTESIQEFAERLRSTRRVVVVGNGGIALELVGEVRGVELVWALRHGHIGDAFFDADAAAFLLEEMRGQQRARGAPQRPQEGHREWQQQADDQQQEQREQRASPDRAQEQHGDSTGGAAQPQPRAGGSGGRARRVGNEVHPGAALGPKWSRVLPVGTPSSVTIEPHSEVLGVFSTREEAAAALPAAAAPAAEAPGTATSSSAAAAAAEAAASGGSKAAPFSESSSGAGPDGSGGGDGTWWPVWLALSGPEGSRVLGADLVVSAIGVEPATDWLPATLERSTDGGLLVGADMRTSDPRVFAAGDCCTLRRQDQAAHFFQMRLWTQARLMGLWAAHGMAGREDDSGISFAFELFTHATRFLGKKVVFLGLYGGQKLTLEPRGDVVMYSRSLDAGTPHSTFVRVLLLRGRLQGAVLIGETGLEETFENLILDGLDIGGYGPALLDPDVELDHVFD